MFRGMFAFVLYDTREDRLVAARDHFGQKPLYYQHKGPDIIIASDVRSILALSGDRKPDLASYAIYLSTTGQTGTRGQSQVGKTFFENCLSLPAGHLLAGISAFACPGSAPCIPGFPICLPGWHLLMTPEEPPSATKFCSSHNRPAPEAVTSARADLDT